MKINEIKLNNAAWTLFEELSEHGSVSDKQINKLKPCLRAAIEKYMKDDKKSEQKPNRTAESTAIETLNNLGYKWKGGQLWKPPLGKMPNKFKPRVSVSYEKVKFDKLSEAFAEHEKAPLYCDDSDIWYKLDDNNVFSNFTNGHPLYRKIETGITPMQAAKGACKEFIGDGEKIAPWCSFSSFYAEPVTDEHRRTDEYFIEICRAIVNAYDGVE